MQNPKRKPEIMSPAGYWPQLHAAIEAGADAVYFGLKHFSARAKVGFTLTELPKVMRATRARRERLCHVLGEKSILLCSVDSLFGSVTR